VGVFFFSGINGLAPTWKTMRLNQTTTDDRNRVVVSC
jgi:hypothetical protein